MSTNPASGSTSTSRADANAGTTSADAPTKRRPGRPRMKDSLPADPNDNSRRSRMRLAQRSYRSRKENELATTRARADALQRALNSSLDEFIRFHELSSGKEKDLPSDFVLQLNRTAMNIMAIARSAQADHWPALDHADRLLAASTGDDNYASSYHGKDNKNNKSTAGEKNKSTAGEKNKSTAGEDDGSSTYILRDGLPAASSSWGNASSSSSSSYAPPERHNPLRPKPVTISQRLMRACVDRAASMLHLTSSPVMCLLPAMLLPLQHDRRDNLLSRTMRYLSITHDDAAALTLDAEHSLQATRRLPRMLRTVEGQGSSSSSSSSSSTTMVPRAPPPNLQRLQFGRTRTVLATALPDLQGEWLEASDVEEYLEQRGIFIRQDAPDADMLNLAIPVVDVDSGAGLSLQATDLNDVNRQNPVRMVRGHPHFVESAAVMPIPTAAPPFPHHRYHQHQQLQQQQQQQQQGLPPMSMQQSLDSNFAVNPDYAIFGQQRDIQVVPSGLRMFTPTAWSFDDSANIIPMDMAMRNNNQPNNSSSSSSSNSNNNNNNHSPDHINIMVNLDNLIVKLASKAVCLGPCPGIRRGHVDEAIRDSVVQMPPM
ncbi:hypothetical protein BBK36DRAFT_1135932 [Trichoderma citrinoviride]|uniref:BZIP domain-containing protein n=1 Tax=Trichoderma citrinoviride TaxID=58853 RepID=A0A2T4B683_9HYPO|nr:hypothetical protein BBK36DRAFT_1135932 [Trichoderma citrinoviride]PTB64835.1 hypothetical protein BBK36DRAFT_1135932 [Trichoderma citrinoviride]